MKIMFKLYIQFLDLKMYRMNLFLDIIRRNEERLMNNLDPIDQLRYPFYEAHFPSLIVPFTRDLMIEGRNMGRQETSGMYMRTRVYNENMYAEPLPDLSGRFRDCSTAYYRDNPAQTHRLHGFMIRDIRVIRNIIRYGTSLNTGPIPSIEYIAATVMRAVSVHEIRDFEMYNLLSEFLGEYTPHFCHELHNFANSPYDMIGYDRNVSYTSRGPYTPLLINTAGDSGPLTLPPVPLSISLIDETIILDSDGDDDVVETGITRYRQNPDVIIVSSSTEEDNSDVEILEHSFRPIETFNSSLDQPSTSTGIRASTRPNSRYNLRRRAMFSPHLSRMQCVRGGRIVIDSSSDDDDPILPPTTMRTKNRFTCLKRRKMKKNKVKKRKRNNDDSRSEIHNGSRDWSSSDSSSSSTDIEAGPRTNFVPLRTNISTIN